MTDKRDVKYRVWDCKLAISVNAKIPEGFDLPLRKALRECFAEYGITQVDMFSGWNGELTTEEIDIIENSIKSIDTYLREAGDE